MMIRICSFSSFLALGISMLFLAIASCAPQPSESGPDIPALKLTLDSLGKAGIYNGVVLVANRDSVLISKAYGIADESAGVSNSIETKFNLASMGKMFTAVAVLRLREKGLLRLDQTVGEFLPDYPLTVVRDSVTIQHLLTHTSGLGDYLDERMEAIELGSIVTLEDYLNLFADDALRFSPGAEFSYSNAGYVVLGLIVEDLTGTDFATHLRRSLFEPLGMSSTGWVHGDTLVKGIALAYISRDSAGALVENPYTRPREGKPAWGVSAAGGGFSTAGDLLRFARALNAGELVSISSLSEMIDTTGGREYGFGLRLNMLNGHRVYGHNGGFPGVAGEVDILPDDGYFIITLSNFSPRSGWVQTRGVLREAILGRLDDAKGVANAEALFATLNAKGLDAALAQLDTLQTPVDERQLVSKFEASMNAGDPDATLALAELAIAAFPTSWFAISVRADAYEQLGREEEAIVGWKESLLLNPDNYWARDKLAERGK